MGVAFKCLDELIPNAEAICRSYIRKNTVPSSLRKPRHFFAGCITHQRVSDILFCTRGQLCMADLLQPRTDHLRWFSPHATEMVTNSRASSSAAMARVTVVSGPIDSTFLKPQKLLVFRLWDDEHPIGCYIPRRSNNTKDLLPKERHKALKDKP